MVGDYYIIESGSCGGNLISTKSECDAAATALDLSRKTAWDHTSVTSSYNPPGCQRVSWVNGFDLRVYGGGSSGSCSSSRQCICKSTSPCTDGGAFAKNGTLIDDEYLYVLRLLVEDSTKLDALASLLRSEHGSWTAHAPGMLKLKMTSNKYGTVLWTDSRTTWQNFTAFKAYLSWRSCYGPIPEAAVWPYNVCEPTCNGGTANGVPLCMGSDPSAGGSFLNSLMGLTTAENQAFYGRLGPGLFGPEALSESYEFGSSD